MRNKLRVFIVGFVMLFALVLASCTKTFDITFDADGGTPVPEIQKVEKGELVTRPETDPAKEGYVFLDWYLDNEAYDFSKEVEGNLTLVAKWEEDTSGAELEALDALKGHYKDTIGKTGYKLTEDVELLTEIEGFSITWSSNNVAAFSNTGEVVRPDYKDGDASIILQAKISEDAKHNFRFIVEALDQTVEEKIEAALDVVTTVPSSATGYQETNFEAVKTFKIDGEDVTVTWTTSDKTVMTEEGKLVSFEDEAEKTVTLTASITYEEVTLTREIEFLVKGVTEYESFSEALVVANEDEKVKVNGVAVYGDLKEGFYLISTDGSLAYHHGVRNKDTMPEGKVFDVILTVDNYYDAFQIKNLAPSNVRDGDLPTRVHPVMTFEDVVNASLPAKANVFNHFPFTLEDVKVFVNPKESDTNYNAVIVKGDFDPATDSVNDKTAIMVYYHSKIDALKAIEGKQIDSIQLVMNGYRTDKKLWYANFFDTKNDIEVTLTDEDKVEAAASKIDGTLLYNYFKDEDIILPTKVDEVTVAWTTEDADIIDIAKKKVLAAAVTVQKSVTLTATLTLNEETKIVTFTTIVGPLETETLDIVKASEEANKTRWFKVTVVVTANSGNNQFTAEDSKGAIAIYYAGGVNDIDKLEKGYEYTLVGVKDVYNGLVQLRDFDSIVKGEEQALPEAKEITIADLKNMLPYQSHLVSIEDVKVESKKVDNFGTVDLVLKAGNNTVAFRWDNRVVLTEEAKTHLNSIVVGDTLNLVGAPVAWFNGPQIAYDDISQIVIVEPEGVEDAVEAAVKALELPDLVTKNTDLELSTEGRFNTTIEWTSSDEDVITTAGVITLQATNKTVYLTAKVSLEDYEVTKVFGIYVQKDEDILNVYHTRKLEKDDLVVFQGVVSGIGKDRYVYITDPDGLTINLFYQPTDMPSDVKVGDFVEVAGKIDVFNGLLQVKEGVVTIKSSDNPVPDAVKVDKIPKFTEDDQGKRYSIDNLIVVSASARSITVTDGLRNVTVYSDMNVEEINTHLAGAKGKKVNLVDIHLGWFNTGQFLIYDVSEVVINDLTNQDKVNVSKNVLNDEFADKVYMMESAITLPSKTDFDVNVAWTFDPVDAISNGKWKEVTEDTDVTLTATLTIGDLTEELLINAKIRFIDKNIQQDKFVETFNDLELADSTGYSGEYDFEGAGGSEWSVKARTNTVGEQSGTPYDYSIDGQGFVLRQESDDGFIQVTLPNGITEFSFEYRKSWTGQNARQYKVDVMNDGETVTYDIPEFGAGSGAQATIYTWNYTGEQLQGEVIIKVYVVGSSGNQATLDNFKWTENK